MAKQKQKNPPPSKTKTVVDDQGKTEWTVYSMLKFFFIATTGLQIFWICLFCFFSFLFMVWTLCLSIHTIRERPILFTLV